MKKLLPTKNSWLVSVVAAAAIAMTVVAPASAQAADVSVAASGPRNGVTTTDAGGQSPSGATCTNYFIPVQRSTTDPQTYKVWGQLCSRGPLEGKTVQLLMEGGTYTHVYWDWPRQPGTYSYVDHATDQGYATFNLDRLGYGESDHPNPVGLDFETAAYVEHQVVQRLRNGDLGTAFQRAIPNGHSMGGLVAEIEAARFRDVDGLIISGFGHNLPVGGAGVLLPNTTPREVDPKFASERWLPGYLTTRPGSRCTIFSFEGDNEPEQCDVEERTKGTDTAVENVAIAPESFRAITRTIDVPVFWALGVHDKLWCPETNDCRTSPTVDRERGFWQPGLLTQYIAPRSGHSINISYSAPDFYQRSTDWLRSNNL